MCGEEESHLSIYKVHFKWKEKEVEISAKKLDLTHPYFVSIKDLIFPKKHKLIIDPTEDELVNRFGNSEHLMIPFQSVSLIEEVSEEGSGKEKVTQFKVLDREEGEDTEE
jgi:hypothetical protein